jgi:hypothetical protein
MNNDGHRDQGAGDRYWLIVALLAVLWLAAANLAYRRRSRPTRLMFSTSPSSCPSCDPGDSFAEQIARLVEHYAQQGRANVAAYAGLILNHRTWGASAVGWQQSRMAQLAIVSVVDSPVGSSRFQPQPVLKRPAGRG